MEASPLIKDTGYGAAIAKAWSEAAVPPVNPQPHYHLRRFMPKTPYKKAVAKLDKVFSEYIRRRDTVGGVGNCCSCGKSTLYGAGDCGHFINRRWMATRWREDNCHFQCRFDNRFNEGDLPGYYKFMVDKYGQDHVDYLYALSRETAKFTIPEIELMVKEYRAKLKEEI